MSMTMAEKILSRTSGNEAVGPGEFVTACADRIMLNDMVIAMVDKLREIGLTEFYDADRVVVVFDHLFPAPSSRHADMMREATTFLQQYGLQHFLGAAGVSHQVMCEQGFVTPGDLVLGTDSHSSMYGAMGAAGAGIGATEMVYLLATGELWFQVPESIRIELTERPSPGVTAKDIVLHLIGTLGGDYGRYRAIEYAGEAASAMTLSQRMTIANMGVEIGAKFAFFEADQKTLDYLAATARKPATPFKADPGATYLEQHRFDISSLEPQVACPHNPENVKPVSAVAGTRVDQAYLGSCTNARLDDIAIAAHILKDRQVHPGTRLLVAPASNQVLLDATREGYIETLLAAGAHMLPAGCGACAGLHSGLLGRGEVGISSTNRNFPGRMGSPDSELYLASPAAVASAAITGQITDPREFWAEVTF
jgi:3-isopropylmalate dehydratase large subunit